MKTRILYVERKPVSSPSIERVFRQIAKELPTDEFEVSFQAMPYGDGLLNLIRNLLFFRPANADIYHVTGHVHYAALRLPRNRTVLTIHDLILLRIRTGFRRWLIERLYLRWPLRRVRQVTAISEFTKGEIEFFAGAAADVTVIEDPLIDGFDPEPRRAFNSDRPVTLHIGTASNKNLENLIDAFRGLSCTLRIIGRLDQRLREELLRSGIQHENAVGLGQEAMTEEYRNCDIVSFCSTYEGFGLPIIEAQAMEKPLITSDLEPMRSISGAGALHVDPHDPGAIRAGIEHLVRHAELREQLVNAGKQNVQRFDPKAIANKYADLYRKVTTEGEQV
jgi:glycosyltransferase involved in cell wall biosynthesis